MGGGREILMGLTPASIDRRAFTTLEPIGLAAAISAFNHPLNLIVHQVVPAIAVGSPVIIKPATDTPLSCVDFAGLLHEAGLPPRLVPYFSSRDQRARRGARDRSPHRLSEFHRFEPRRLVSPVQTATGNAMRVGARRRRAGNHRPQYRTRPAHRTADERWVLPCRPGLRVGSSDLCSCGPRERISRPLRRPCGGVEGR